MAGGYPCYYYTYTAWDVIPTADTPPGYRYFKLLREFFELRLTGLEQPLRAEWFNPFKGERRGAGEIVNGRNALSPPEDWSGIPVVLHAGGRSRL